MARIKKFAPRQRLSAFQTFLVDEKPNSEYFRITEFKDTFTGGKNGFLIEGSEYLKESTEIKIEILDVNGDPVYYEPGGGIPQYYEGTSKLIAVYVYNDTPIGLGKITILGELKDYISNNVKLPIPDEWKGTYNVRWERTFQINKNLSNEDRVRFHRRPNVTIDEIVKPIFSGDPPLVTQSGSVNGTPLVPSENVNLLNFSLPTSYRLKVNTGSNWTGSMVGQSITFNDISYSPIIDEVVNETEIIVSPPYTEDNLVKSFNNEDYSITFPHIEGAANLATSLTGSFAKINITDMKTYVGDVARVKVYRRSQSNLTDYEFIQEIQLESNELLRDITTFNKKEENYGIFTEDILNLYWVTSSNDMVIEFNQNFLYNSVRLNSTPENYFHTSQSFSIQDGVEYTLDLNVRKTQNTPGDYLKAFLSGSNNSSALSQPILTVNSSNSLLQKTNLTTNIIANPMETASLYFEVNGSDWYINNVSLKASQETAFSPDEITFVQQVPKILLSETFDYRFEFYDINNNVIPIRVETTKTFVGGNTNLFNKRLEITPSNLYFSFGSASNSTIPLPPLAIDFDVETTLVTGSINYTSGAYDLFGNLLPEVSYSMGQYPGLLTNLEVDGGRQPILRVEDFTGSRSDITVQYIQYTGEVEGVSDSFIITRVENGKVGENGLPGAGVVYRGEFDSDKFYFHTDQRRDIVLHNGSYFITDNEAKSGTDTWGTPPTDWESFGAEFSSVATDILFAQDVFANRTINIGASGGSPVIAINADSSSGYQNPFISIGQGANTGFGEDGIFLGYSDGDASFSLLASGSKANIGGWNIDKQGIYFEGNVVVGFTTQSASTVVATSNIFPPEITTYGSSSIKIPIISGVEYDITARNSASDITIDSSIYVVSSSFQLTYVSGAYQTSKLSTINDPDYPGSWRTDYTNQTEVAANEIWEVPFLIDINEPAGGLYSISNATHPVGYSMLTVSGGIENSLGFVDESVKRLIDIGFIRRDSPIDIREFSTTSPKILIRDSYDPSSPTDPGPFLGSLTGSGSFDERTFYVIDIINSSDPTLTFGYDTFILGYDTNVENFFEDYYNAYLNRYGITTNESNQPWDGVSTSPSLFNTITFFSTDLITESSNIDYGGATVSAGALAPVTESVDVVRIASTGSNNSENPYISMGQVNQLYDEPGIFIGYSSGSSIGQLSLKSSGSAGTRFFKWTGNDVELSGTVTTTNGNIGGFVIGNNTIRDVGNNLILNSNGEITGSGALFATEVDSVEYVVLDTANGIIDAKNNGRHIYFDSTESTVVRSGSNGTTFGTPTTIVWQGLTHESRLNISLQSKVEKQGNCRGIGGVRATLYTSPSGSSSGSDASYDNWTQLRQKTILSVGSLGEVNDYTASVSQIGLDSSDDIGKYFQIDNYIESGITYNHKQHQSNLLKLEIEPFAQTNLYVDGDVTTYIKNISVTTGRGLASTYDVSPSQPVFPFPIAP
jgi:hypothetical protein